MFVQDSLVTTTATTTTTVYVGGSDYFFFCSLLSVLSFDVWSRVLCGSSSSNFRTVLSFYTYCAVVVFFFFF